MRLHHSTTFLLHYSFGRFTAVPGTTSDTGTSCSGWSGRTPFPLRLVSARREETRWGDCESARFHTPLPPALLLQQPLRVGGFRLEIGQREIGRGGLQAAGEGRGGERLTVSVQEADVGCLLPVVAGIDATRVH